MNETVEQRKIKGFEMSSVKVGMNTKKHNSIPNDQKIDAILKKARVPAKALGDRERFAKQVLRRIRSGSR